MKSSAKLIKASGAFVLASAFASAALWPATAQQQAQPVPYRPGVGDFMTAGVQPRHIKLAAAGQAGNWAYAAYALKEMGESFDRMARTIPMMRQMPTADLIAANIKAPMAALDDAIKAGDATRFKTAYAQLTQGCNSCHQKTDRAMVVIEVPEVVTAFPDQNFKPNK